MSAPTIFKILHLENDRVNALVVGKMLETADGVVFKVSHADSLVKAHGLIAQTNLTLH